MFARFKKFTENYPYYWVSLYFVFYMIWFAWVESRASLPYHVIHFPLDDYIPFCEYFVIPYVLWFAYIAVVYLWLFFHDKTTFFKYIAVIYTGMTLFLIVSPFTPMDTCCGRRNFPVIIFLSNWSASSTGRIHPRIFCQASMCSTPSLHMWRS